MFQKLLVRPRSWLMFGVGLTLARPARASDDRALDPNRPLERTAFVREVLRKNPNIESARNSVRAAVAHVRTTGTFEDPMLELGLAPLSIGAARARVGYEVSVSQKLPWFGKRALEQATASAEAAAAKADYEAVRRELALGAVALYEQYFVETRSLAINAQHIALVEELEAATVAQFGVGRASAEAALEAETELTHLEHDALSLAAERAVTLARMNELLRRAPELPLPPPVADLPLPRVMDASDAALEVEAVEHRPDIAAAKERARAERARAERAERDAYPDVTLSTSYDSMWDMPEHRWTVGLGFNLPFQSGRRAATADEARATGARFESEASQLSDSARTQVYVSRERLRESSHVLALFERRLLPVARRRIEAARTGFSTSATSLGAVLDAERNLRRVELDYQAARAEYGVRRAELDRALGRVPTLDWEESP
jgi:cobalt-zinc-cadmium efflux system outer membrane protein